MINDGTDIIVPAQTDRNESSLDGPEKAVEV